VSVVLSNAQLSAHVFEHPWLRDAQGVAYPGPAQVTVRGPHPGAVTRRDAGPAQDDSPDVWSLRADPALWPLRRGDKLTDGDRVWVITTARNIVVPGVHAADYVACTGTLDPPVVA
jgi:hypothetical protein